MGKLLLENAISFRWNLKHSGVSKKMLSLNQVSSAVDWVCNIENNMIRYRPTATLVNGYKSRRPHSVILQTSALMINKSRQRTCTLIHEWVNMYCIYILQLSYVIAKLVVVVIFEYFVPSYRSFT